MDIKGISASSYQLYDWCNFKFYIQQILGEREDSGPAALLGTMAHKVLEILSQASVLRHYPESKIWDVNYLWQASFNYHYKKFPEIASEIKDDKLKKVCQGIIDLVNSEYTPIKNNTISAEVAFDMPIKDPRLVLSQPNEEPRYLRVRGRIDRVDQINDDTIEIIDYKTGSRVDWNSSDKKKKEPSDLHKDIQPRMYHLSTKQLYPWAKNVLVTFIYLADGGPITMPFCDNDIDTTVNMIQSQYMRIKNDDNPQRINNWKCKMCSFYKEGMCEELWQEKTKLGMKFQETKYKILNNKY
jgi:hypothetical protein